MEDNIGFGTSNTQKIYRKSGRNLKNTIPNKSSQNKMHLLYGFIKKEILRHLG